MALGEGGFADDTAPLDALVAVPDGRGDWSVGETLAEARAAAGKVQGRRTTAAVEPPLALPDGDWATTLRTSWVEPAYLETDAAWCAPGGEPATPLANGGAFGAKVTSPVTGVARTLADRHGRAVRVLLSREDTVRMGPKRPPIAAGVRRDGSGVVRAVATPGLAEILAAVAPELVLEAVSVAGPPTSVDIRAAGWAEVALLRAGLAGFAGPVHSPDGAMAEASVGDGRISVQVRCGDPLDEVVLRSYCTGAAHMALGWVTSEGLAVDADGDGARPDDPLVRHRAGGRHAGHRGRHRARHGSPGERIGRGLRGGGRRGLGRSRMPARPARYSPRPPRRLTMTNPTGLPYTPAIRVGDWVIVSGQIGLVDGDLVSGGFDAELSQALANLEARLAEVDATMADVVKTTVFLRHINDYRHMNDLYGDVFPEPRPARSAFGVSELPFGALVEIEAWAFTGTR